MTVLQNQILREVGNLARSVQYVGDTFHRELNLQRGQFFFLTRICEQPGINLVDLSNQLKIDKTTTTKAIQKLISEGFVERKKKENDKRYWHLYPTMMAKNIYDSIIAEENRCIGACLTGFNESEKETVLNLIRRMGSNIDEEWRKLKSAKDAAISDISEKVVITEYQEKSKEEIITLILDIQQKEYNLPISRKDQPDLENIPMYYQKGGGNFWIAVYGSEIIGTIALIDIDEKNMVMRKMFVEKKWRGGKSNTAKNLLDTALKWARDNNKASIYLGTTDKFLAAHRFYEKNGFARIQKTDLPESFPLMAVDNHFYKLEIKQ